MTRDQARRELRYQPVRKPKLRAAALVVPPPIPDDVIPQDLPDPEAAWDEAEPAEVGLRVLAALESMPSLEPDYCDDLAAEASVTIIECADAGEPRLEPRHAEGHGTLRARLHDMGEVPDILPDEYAAYQGPIEEATVEIVDLSPEGQNAAASHPSADFPVASRPGKART